VWKHSLVIRWDRSPGADWAAGGIVPHSGAMLAPKVDDLGTGSCSSTHHSVWQGRGTGLEPRV